MTVLLCFLPVIAFSGGNSRDSGQRENTQDKTWEYKKIPVLDKNCQITDFPLAYNAPPDKLFRAAFSGKTVSNSFQQNELNIFNDKLVIEIKANYTLSDTKREAAYNVLVFDVQKTVQEGISVSPGDILGRVEQRGAKVVVFSETLDPYLVMNSNRPPVFYAGYFWFDPSFLSAAGNTRWITFEPVNNLDDELKEIAEQTTNESPGFTFYDKRIRFRTKLSQYPRNISEDERASVSVYEDMLYGRNGITSSISEINAGGYKYLLCWQNGFEDYLKKEYILNDDVWLYGTVAAYDVWKGTGYIFLRDFTPVSLEDMYEGRMRELRGD